jgi:hypothetical protein
MDGFDAIGMDILGWDNYSFHSFLCNSLQDEFPDIRFNKYGSCWDALLSAVRMRMRDRSNPDDIITLSEA